MMPSNPQKIISGAQTGVDRAALDVALDLGIPCGGWCRKGRRAEDGTIPDKYPLQETGTRNYTKRTKLNVQDSDGTLIINCGELDGGTTHTVRLSEKMAKPCLVIQLEEQPELNKIIHWLNQTDMEKDKNNQDLTICKTIPRFVALVTQTIIG